MVKHTQAIRRLLPTNCLGVFQHFKELAFTGLSNCSEIIHIALIYKIYETRDGGLLETL